jgi:hypothetical protein
MKRFLLVMVTVTLLVMYASPGEAWKVNIKNSCFTEVEIFVNGQHLVYDDKVDCAVKLASGNTGTCQMPGGICPSRIHGRYYVRDAFGHTYEQQLSPIDCADTGGFKSATCCWDVNVEVTIPLGHCRLERR